jgi:hypothetical protein
MGAALGPKLGLLINSDIGAFYADQFRTLLRAIDALLFASVIDSTATTPPSNPDDGDAYLLINTPTGQWTGAQGAVAVWTTELTLPGTDTTFAGWEFHAPQDGWLVWDDAQQQYWTFSNGSWRVFSGGGVSVADVAFTTFAPGQFQVSHGLNVTPTAVTIEMTSGGLVWFQTTRYDSSNVYLVASDTGLTGHLKVWY